MQDDDYWGMFAAEAARIGSPLYNTLALRIRDDDRLRRIAAHARPGQPQANLILAAVHFLLLGGKSHPLASHYPDLHPDGKPTTDAFAEFRAFCIEHEAELSRLVASRITNTNEVARCTSLYPAFDHIARETGTALHMIEIGPSAGLNLNWNHYAYRFMRNGQAVVERTPQDALLSLSTELRGERNPVLAGALPQVDSKVGLELNPVNLLNPEDRLWLRALIFPELAPRFARLEGAISTALAHPVSIRFGDALDLVAPTVRALPSSGTPVLYHSFVTYQFSTAMRERLERTIRDLSAARPIYKVAVEWVANEHPLTVSRYENGSVDAVVLADCNPHGAWLEWRHEPKAAAE